MRVRLLIDVEWPDALIVELGEMAARQPAVVVAIDDEGYVTRPAQPGRLMGARPVEGGSNDAR